jgi:hypothetical protein
MSWRDYAASLWFVAICLIVCALISLLGFRLVRPANCCTALRHVTV